MSEPALRPGIAEAVRVFWDRIDRRTPLVIPQDGVTRMVVNEALLLALGKLNLIRDGKAEQEQPT